MSDRLTVKQIGETYLVTLPSRPDTWEIDGKRYSPGKLCLCEEPKMIVGVWFKKRLVSYHDPEVDVVLTVEQYETLKAKLTEGVKPGEYGYKWDDLDKEFEYRKFIEQWKEVNEDYEEREAYEIELELFPESPFPSIKSFRMAGKGVKPLFEYTPRLYQLVGEAAQEFGYVQVEDKTLNDNTLGKRWSVPTHSGLEYLKMNGKYAWTGNKNKPDFRGVSAGSLEECTERREEHLETLREAFRKSELLRTNDPVSPADRTWLLSKIGSLRSRLQDVVARARAVDDLHSARRLAKEIEEALEKKEEEQGGETAVQEQEAATS